jgi:catechol 2,3-dioxygenase-like lactoylglutathione lyase family enzyme
VLRFYRDGLGLTVLGGFEGHDGIDGVMLGDAGAAYHLEFTHHPGADAGRAPTADNLLVFYVPDASAHAAAVERMSRAGYSPVCSANPYWDRNGAVTFEDHEGWRVVIFPGDWTPDAGVRTSPA